MVLYPVPVGQISVRGCSLPVKIMHFAQYAELQATNQGFDIGYVVGRERVRAVAGAAAAALVSHGGTWR